MIIVTGSILARQDSFTEVLRLSREHVERSRKEDGCISHDVHADTENPLRLFFFGTSRRCALTSPFRPRATSSRRCGA
jgi:quinol monooxygenase YgiN